MENTTYMQPDKNLNSHGEMISDEAESDVLSSDDEYNLDDYGEFVPNFDAWVAPESQKKRIDEILKRME